MDTEATRNAHGAGGMRLPFKTHARSIVACAWAVALSLLLASPALADVTPISSFTKSGMDRSTGSTATAGGPDGIANGGDTIDWVLSYRNTTGGLATATLTDPIGANQTFVPGSLKTPPGLQPLWSTDGGTTFLDNEPSAGVNAIRAVGRTIDDSTGAQSVVQPSPGGFVAGTGAGDGWEALFIGDNVYNIPHHRQPTVRMFDCHVKQTGERCPGYENTRIYVSETAGQPFGPSPGTGPDTLYTANQPSAAVDQARGRIYFPAGRAATTSIGVACMEVTTRTSCGYVELGTAGVVNGATRQLWASITGGALVGSRYFLMDDNATLYCFDISTGAACGGAYPMAAIPGYDPGTSAERRAQSVGFTLLQAFDGRYVFANVARTDGERDLVCLDATTNAACPGYPVSAYGPETGPITGSSYWRNSVLAPILDADAAVVGICGENAQVAAVAWVCLDLAGQPVANPYPAGVPGTSVAYLALGSVARVGTKVYFNHAVPVGSPQAGVTTYTCFDFATLDDCEGFVNGSSGQAVRGYTIRQDPQNPDCLWAVGDGGIFEVFSATFGGTTCSTSSTTVSVTPADYYCDGSRRHVTGWHELRVERVLPGDYQQMLLTITDANGDPVPGWIARVFPSTQQTIDISDIPVTGSTGTLHLEVTFDDLTQGAPAVVATFSGDPVQVCFQTRVPEVECSAAEPAPNEANAVTVGPQGVGDAPAGNNSGIARFIVTGDPSQCEADLGIVKSGPSTARPGTNLTYELRVTDHGPAAARDVVVSDPLPAGLTFVSASAGCTAAGAAVTCTVPSLAVGESATFQITGHIAESAVGSVINTGTVTGSPRDPNPSNDKSSKTTTIIRDTAEPPPVNGHPPPVDDDDPITQEKPVLRLRKTVSRGVVRAGERFIYRLRVSNPGTVTVHDVVVCDRLPGGIDFVASTPTARLQRGQYCWRFKSLAAGRSKKIAITVRALAGAHGRCINRATAVGRGTRRVRDSVPVRINRVVRVPQGGVTG